MTRHRDDGSNRNVVTGDLKYLFREEQLGFLLPGANLPPAANSRDKTSLSKPLR
jgi:hypothetical protein